MGEPEQSLEDLLRLAEWSPRQLVAAINARLSSQGRDRMRLDPTAGYSWVRRGFRPRPPVPDIAAAVLSDRLGFTLTPAQLWPGRADPGDPICATNDLDTVVSPQYLANELGKLAVIAGTPRSPIAPASGADLAGAVIDQFRGTVKAAYGRSGQDRVLPEQVDLISAHVAALRRLDDRHGGGALSLRYVTAELRSVLDLVEHSSYDPVTGRRLLTLVADVAQLLGWLSFDSGRTGPAERYLLLSLGVCRSLDDAGRAANVIGMLSYVSAFAGHGIGAVRLAEAAMAECAKPGPVLRARLLGRDATAAAADGDLVRFRRQSAEAAVLLHRHTASAQSSSFLYYLTAEQLAAETGLALVLLAERASMGRKRLLTQAIDALSDAVPALSRPDRADGRAGFPRSALLHAAFLARAWLLHGDLEGAVAAMRTGVSLLDQVQSPRARSYLQSLRPVLARRSRSPVVRDFLDEIREASSPM